jgi:hypothetical protein
VALLVLDEQLTGKSLVAGLRGRGLAVKTVKDFGVTQTADPDVVKTVAERHDGPWVLVTMDTTIVEEHRGFDWTRYAIAWVVVPEHLTGLAFDQAKANVLHNWALDIVELRPGEHRTYYARRHTKSRPSLSSQLRRKL